MVYYSIIHLNFYKKLTKMDMGEPKIVASNTKLFETLFSSFLYQ